MLLAGLVHRTNTFVGGRTGLEDFEIWRGEELLVPVRGASAIAGVLEVARESDWEVVPVLDMRTLPDPTVADAVVDQFWAEFRAVAEGATGDAVEHRPAYAPVTKASYTVGVPRPCTEDLRRLPFGRVVRPVYPLDEL